MNFELGPPSSSSSSFSRDSDDDDIGGSGGEKCRDEGRKGHLHRSAMHLAVGKICREEEQREEEQADASANISTNADAGSINTSAPVVVPVMNREAIVALTDLAYAYATSSLASDLVAFSDHAKNRRTINASDVLLVARKHVETREELERFLEEEVRGGVGNSGGGEGIGRRRKSAVAAPRSKKATQGAKKRADRTKGRSFKKKLPSQVVTTTKKKSASSSSLLRLALDSSNSKGSSEDRYPGIRGGRNAGGSSSDSSDGSSDDGRELLATPGLLGGVGRRGDVRKRHIERDRNDGSVAGRGGGENDLRDTTDDDDDDESEVEFQLKLDGKFADAESSVGNEIVRRRVSGVAMAGPASKDMVIDLASDDDDSS